MKNLIIFVSKLSSVLLVIFVVVWGIYWSLEQTKFTSTTSPVVDTSTEIEVKDITTKAANTTNTRPYIKYPFIEWGEMFQKRLYEYFPKEIADFLDSYIKCEHWNGEYAYDAERTEDIEQGTTSNCINFDALEQTLAVKYKNTQKWQEFQITKGEIESGREGEYSFIWNDPNKESKALNEYIEAFAQGILETVKEQMQEYNKLVANNADNEKLKNIRWLLSVQKNYINTIILPQIERLHPITRKGIETLKADQEFLGRANITS